MKARLVLLALRRTSWLPLPVSRALATLVRTLRRSGITGILPGPVPPVVEACLRHCPEQYQWEYKRFRTRPRGDHDFHARDWRPSNAQEN